MDYFDKENYQNLLNIHNLNKKIHLALIEIKEYEAKKKNNIYFLKIQNNLFEKVFTKKYATLKKYYYRMIKNAITIAYNKKKNNELMQIILQNNILINKYNNSLFNLNSHNLIQKKSHIKLFNKYDYIINSINNYITLNKKSIEYNKLEKKYNLLKNNIQLNLQNNIISLDFKSKNLSFYNYIYYYNLDLKYNFTLEVYNNITLYFIKLNKLNIEFIEYNKFYSLSKKNIHKLTINNNKYNKIILKNNKQNELIIKKSEDIKNKYNYIQKYILIQEKKNLTTQFNFVKNIHELNIRLDLNKEILKGYKLEIEKLQELLKLSDNIKGKYLNNSDQCMICLEEITYGITTNCNHNFHYSCINLYIFNILNQLNKIEIKCPICRQFI
jgi:hypothetical protein